MNEDDYLQLQQMKQIRDVFNRLDSLVEELRSIDPTITPAINWRENVATIYEEPY